MNTLSLVFATAVARWWVHFYTLGVPSTERDTTRAEVDSDLWEEERHARQSGTRPVETARQIFGRLVLSIPTDVAWRLSSGGTERQAARLGISMLKMGGSATYRSLGSTGVAVLALVGVISVAAWVNVALGPDGQMAQPVRYHHTATLLDDGRVLVTGGQTVLTYGPPASGLVSSEIYDPSTGHWSTTGPMGAPHRFHGAILLEDGRVLVSGGLGNRSRRDACCADLEYVFSLASAEIFDPSTETWSSAGEMLKAKGRHTLTQLQNGTVFAIGGAGTSAQLYDPTARTWESGGDSQTERDFRTAVGLRNGTALVIGGGDLVAGGGPHEALDLAEVYDPLAGSWSPTDSMMEKRRKPTATVMGDGRILVTGGSADGNGTPLATAEIYDPWSGTWSSAGEMMLPRELHTATLLKDGRVFVAGGSSNKITEIYDPARGRWLKAASMSEPRRAQTATLLKDGRVLVAGGTTGSNGKPLPSKPAEIYNPSTDTWTVAAAVAH